MSTTDPWRRDGFVVDEYVLDYLPRLLEIHMVACARRLAASLGADLDARFQFVPALGDGLLPALRITWTDGPSAAAVAAAADFAHPEQFLLSHTVVLGQEKVRVHLSRQVTRELAVASLIADPSLAGGDARATARAVIVGAGADRVPPLLLHLVSGCADSFDEWFVPDTLTGFEDREGLDLAVVADRLRPALTARTAAAA